MADRRDAEHQVLAEAEGRLFAKLGLEYHSHRVGLEHAPVATARVVETGTGPPVLFVHGAGMSAAVWVPLLSHLPHRRCIAVDLPGCGLTDSFDYRGVDLREHARSFLTAVLAALGLDATPVVANSLGATFGLYLATAEPSRVSKLVLMGATGVALPGARASVAMRMYSRPAVGRLLSTLSPPIRPSLARRLLASVCGQQAVDGLPEAMFDAMAVAMRLSEPTTRTLMPELFSGRTPHAGLALTDEELGAVTTPTAFVWGIDDRFQGPEAAERAVAVMPSASVTVVSGGHHPWWDDAARCAERLDHHLADGPGAPPA